MLLLELVLLHPLNFISIHCISNFVHVKVLVNFFFDFFFYLVSSYISISLLKFTLFIYSPEFDEHLYFTLPLLSTLYQVLNYLSSFHSDFFLRLSFLKN